MRAYNRHNQDRLGIAADRHASRLFARRTSRHRQGHRRQPYPHRDGQCRSVQRPASVLEQNHLRVSMDTSPSTWMVLWRRRIWHIEKVLNFVRGWDRSAPMVALPCRHQPFDRERLCGGLHAQSAPRRNCDRAVKSAPPADRPAQPADRQPADKALTRRTRCARWTR